MSRSRRTACWLAAAVLTGAVGGLVASIAPPRLRLIGLFAIALGAVLGWLAGRLAVTLRMSSRRVAVLGGILAGATGCVVATLLHWQAYSHELQSAGKSSTGQALMANMLKAAEENAPTDSESQAALAEFRDSASRALDELKRRSSFTGYLSHRTAGLGLTGSTAAALWGLEVLFAGIAGAFIAQLPTARPFCSVCDDFLIASRRYQFRAPLPTTVFEIIDGGGNPLEDNVVLRLYSCRCGNTVPRVSYETTHSGVTGVTSGSREISRDQLQALKRLMDQADGIDCPS